jgi:hypothetical protein
MVVIFVQSPADGGRWCANGRGADHLGKKCPFDNAFLLIADGEDGKE